MNNTQHDTEFDADGKSRGPFARDLFLRAPCRARRFRLARSVRREHFAPRHERPFIRGARGRFSSHWNSNRQSGD